MFLLATLYLYIYNWNIAPLNKLIRNILNFLNVLFKKKEKNIFSLSVELS